MLISHGGAIKHITCYSLENSLMESDEAPWFDDSASDKEMVQPICMTYQVKNF